MFEISCLSNQFLTGSNSTVLNGSQHCSALKLKWVHCNSTWTYSSVLQVMLWAALSCSHQLKSTTLVMGVFSLLFHDFCACNPISTISYILSKLSFYLMLICNCESIQWILFSLWSMMLLLTQAVLFWMKQRRLSVLGCCCVPGGITNTAQRFSGSLWWPNTLLPPFINFMILDQYVYTWN